MDRESLKIFILKPFYHLTCKTLVLTERYRWFLGASFIILAAIFFSPSSPIFYSKETGKPSSFNDFLFYYGASKITQDGNPDQIYSTELQQETLANITGVSVKKLIPYLYPPQSLLFFAPFASFSPTIAFLIWQTINIIGTFTIIKLLCLSGAHHKEKKTLLISALLIVSSAPWITTILQGQVTILMVIGLLGYQLLAKKGKNIFAGLLVVICAFKPPLFLASVLYVLLINGKKLWAATILSSVAVVVICSAIFGLGIWKSYLDVMLFASSESDSGANLIAMCNIRALAFLLFGSEHMAMINGVSILLWIASILFSIYLALKAKGKTEKTQDLAFGLAVAMGCLFGPWSHLTSLMLLVIPIGYLVKYTRFTPSYIYIGGMVNFGLLTLFIATLKEELNSVIWVPAQLMLIILLIRLMVKEHKKTFVPVVS